LNDTFLPHGLDEGQVEDIRRQLEDYREVSRAFLVRKQVAFFPLKPFYVMVVEADGTPGSELTAADQRIVDRLAEDLRLPGQTLIFTPKGGFMAVAKVIRMEQWTLLYERHRSGNATAAA
jgi:hypothetical protein